MTYSCESFQLAPEVALVRNSIERRPVWDPKGNARAHHHCLTALTCTEGFSSSLSLCEVFSRMASQNKFRDKLLPAQ